MCPLPFAISIRVAAAAALVTASLMPARVGLAQSKGDASRPVTASADLSEQQAVTPEPYTVFVAQVETFARCGPSGDYYRTDPLRHGQELEVYVETDDGWLGIRPPGDSFCWVPADAVQLDGDSGTIVEDRTVAWIGTHLGRARRYRWQVQMAEGEPVTVLGRSERDGPDGPQMWYRIVPPSGEFRWVHRDQVVETPEQLIAMVKQAAGEAIEFLPGASSSAQNTQDALADAASRPHARDNAPQPLEVGEAAKPIAQASRSRRVQSSAELSQAEHSQGGRSAEPRSADRDRPSSRRRIKPLRRASAESVSTRPTSQAAELVPPEPSDEAIGSGLRGDWQAKVISRPRLQEIGMADPDDSTAVAADTASDVQSDGNWIAGAARVGSSIATAGASVIQQVSGQQPVPPQKMTPHTMAPQTTHGNGGLMPPASSQPENASGASLGPHPEPLPDPMPMHVVSGESIARVAEQTRDADVQQLQIILSRAMAAGSSAAEVQPIANALSRIANESSDPATSAHVRSLTQRIEQYQRVAKRRDGQPVVQTSGSLSVPSWSSSRNPAAPVAQSHGAVIERPYANPATGTLLAGNPVSGGLAADSDDEQDLNGPLIQSGTLVRVYSARENSPPYALTDNIGQTLAYVTPMPGVNLRVHLNSRINVTGTRGFVPGLNTPHILATRAVRTME